MTKNTMLRAAVWDVVFVPRNASTVISLLKRESLCGMVTVRSVWPV